jgi:lipoprotein-anchoring transpeptidase ErfK/SrfK
VAHFPLGTWVFSRRALLTGVSALAVAGCATTSAPKQSREVDPAYQRKVVTYDTREAPGTIVVDPAGFGWSGLATVQSKQEWPDWYPPKEMLERRPDLQEVVRELQSGLGVAGGPENPLGARAMYLWQGNKDTLYRIHGTNEPWTIGQNVSAGCIRMTNEDVVDLYDRTAIGTKVVVLPPLSS